MAFLRGAADITEYEAVLYSHWIVTVQLIEIGVSCEAIQGLSNDDINMILGTKAAFIQRENDEHARSMASSKASMPTNIGGKRF